MSNDSMNWHPIRVVSARTGLSPDVLRAWERRHGAVAPMRSEAGQRLYSNADIERLVLLVKVTRTGRAVGRTAALSMGELRRLAEADVEHGASGLPTAEVHLERALSAVMDLAPERLKALLRSALLSLGVSGFLDDVVTPLQRKIGEAWQAGAIGIAHEHAASSVVSRVLGFMIDTITVPEGAPRAVVACLADERHELGAMLAAADAAHTGWRVLYLGLDVPAADIVAAALRHGVDVVGVSVTHSTNAAASRFELQTLRRSLQPQTPLFAGGAGVPALGPLEDGILLVRDLKHWRTLLRAHAPGGR